MRNSYAIKGWVGGSCEGDERGRHERARRVGIEVVVVSTGKTSQCVDIRRGNNSHHAWQKPQRQRASAMPRHIIESSCGEARGLAKIEVGAIVFVML